MIDRTPKTELTKRSQIRLLLILTLALLLPIPVQAQGILLLAHGGSDSWNQEVLELASRVDSILPTEVAFGMANKRTIQDAVERLRERDVTEIVAVPLFISSHSSVIRATQYLLGSRAEPPPHIEVFARMGQRKSEGTAGDAAPDFDWISPLETTLPLSVTTALDSHMLVADILVARALEVSQQPEEEVVLLVAHGPASGEDNKLWLAEMSDLAEQMQKRIEFHRIEWLTVRDDAPEPVRQQATAELRALVESASQEGRTVLVVPLLLSYGGIEVGIRQRLEGLAYRMTSRALLPDDRLVQWVLKQATNGSKRKPPPDALGAWETPAGPPAPSGGPN